MSLVEFFASQPSLFHAGVFLTGLAVGSFLNVVMYRLPRRMQQEWRRDCCALLNVPPPADLAEAAPGLVFPSSRCPHCGHAIAPWENIPVISYLLLRGKCSSCRQPISRRYPLVELLTASLSLLVSLRFGVSAQTIAALLFTWSLIALSGIDLEHQLLPDDIAFPLLWLGLLVNIFMLFAGLISALLGVMAGYLVLWIVYHVFRLLTGKEGMGYGDFKLLAALGAWNGIQMLPFMLVAASLAGSIIGISMMFLGKWGREHKIPFGPYLAIAGWVALLWGPQVTATYVAWAGR